MVGGRLGKTQVWLIRVMPELGNQSNSIGRCWVQQRTLCDSLQQSCIMAQSRCNYEVRVDFPRTLGHVHGIMSPISIHTPDASVSQAATSVGGEAKISRNRQAIQKLPDFREREKKKKKKRKEKGGGRSVGRATCRSRVPENVPRQREKSHAQEARSGSRGVSPGLGAKSPEWCALALTPG
jgi:hypothetical protein